MDIIKLLELNKKNIISIAGGGGKSSLLYTLSKSIKNYYKKRTLTTTTVKMAMDYNIKNFDLFSHTVSDKEIFEIYKKNKDKKTFLLFSSLDKNTNKLTGYSPEILDELYEKEIFYSIINEADGSKNLPIKAPNENEPQHPKNTTYVFGIIGLSSYNKIIDDSVVHRVSIFNKITNTKIGDVLTKEVILKLVLSNEGLFKNTPPNSKKYLILNQADTIKKDELNNLINYLYYNLTNINSVIATSLQNSSEAIIAKSF